MRENKKNITPPRIAQRILLSFLKPDLAEEVLGDLEEKFFKTVNTSTALKAKRNYWYQVLKYVRPFAIKKSKFQSFKNNGMFSHFLKISWRNLMRNKVFSSIKIGGFSIGIAACILISLFITHELSYDKHYKHGDQIFRIANNYQSSAYSEKWTNLHGPFKPVLEEHIPEIEEVSRVVLWKWGNVGENHIRETNSTSSFYEEGFFYADPELLQILEISMVYGNQKNALVQPNSLVISKRKADIYFPNQNPIGKQLILNENPEDTYTIGGVMENFPATSHLQGDFIMTLKDRKSGPGTSGWCCTNYNFYVRLSPKTDKTTVENKITTIRDTYVLDELAKIGNTDISEEQNNKSFYLQPVTNLYLNPEKVYDGQSHGSAEIIWVFGTIAGIILLIACLNFINLSTAKSIKRAKEVGLRKVVGSVRSNLISQYLSESVFLCLLSVLLGVLIAYLAMPFFNQIANKNLSLPFMSSWFIPSLALIAFVIGILSGIYPALQLSRFKPVEALKGISRKGANASTTRSVMVVFQFTATVILIIGALATHQQFQHYMNKSLGFDKDQVINILGMNTIEEKDRDVIKNEILKLASIENATYSNYLPVSGAATTNFGFWIDGKKQDGEGFEAARWTVDEDYLNTMSMTIINGRNFSKNSLDDNSIIINERMAELFGLQNPVGTQVIDMFDSKYQIIGVVKNFHFESLTSDIRPLAMIKGKGNNILSLKIKPENMQAGIASITSIWNKFKPNQSIRYSFMDSRFKEMYNSLFRIKTIFLLFSGLSIVVACLGLFALSAYIIEQRGKEVSVRKVLGASVSKLFTILALDFIKLVIISIIIAIPIGWYLMNDFLSEMANRITLSWSLFTIAAIAALVIALLTISVESIKAAMVSPAKRLRSE